MKDKAFLDTNLLIYLYSQTEIDKKETAEQLLEDYEVWISTQVLAELSNVLFKKFAISWQSIREVIEELQDNFYVYTNNHLTINKATKIAETYQYGFYDSLIISAALSCDCKYLFTEDLHHTQIIDGKLDILNPFK
ncbi:MAG: PIN domain-containing protein [Microscillaceae bacterium]|nr:PIN domain-containing protein [Microscillaceae bacterium]